MLIRLTIILSLIFACKRMAPPASEAKIVNGQEVTDSNDPVYKSTVALLGSNGAFCTGTLIGPNQIVTAAHCIHPNQGGQMGPTGIGFGAKAQAGPGITDIKISYHPKYNYQAVESGGAGYDVGLITFSGSVPAGFEPVDVADPSSVSPGMAIVTAGYGMTDSNRGDVGTLRKLQNTIAQMQQADNEFTNQSPGKNVCQGDSGGPTYIQNGNTLQVIGASSRASNPCSQGMGFHTFVSVYHGWLKCGYEKAGHSLAKLKDDSSSADCAQTQVGPAQMGQGQQPGQNPNINPQPKPIRGEKRSFKKNFY